jgi:hypothetical protein
MFFFSFLSLVSYLAFCSGHNRITPRSRSRHRLRCTSTFRFDIIHGSPWTAGQTQSDPCRLGVSARETRHQLLLICHVGKPTPTKPVCLPTRPSPTRPTLRASSYTSTRLRDTEYLDHALPAPCILNLTARRLRITLPSLPPTRATSSLDTNGESRSYYTRDREQSGNKRILNNLD